MAKLPKIIVSRNLYIHYFFVIYIVLYENTTFFLGVSEEPVVRGQETILLVEDEPAILVVKRIMPLCPDVKALFMSEYTANVIAHHGVLDEGVHFIEKAFFWKILAAKIREVLEG